MVGAASHSLSNRSQSQPVSGKAETLFFLARCPCKGIIPNCPDLSRPWLVKKKRNRFPCHLVLSKPHLCGFTRRGTALPCYSRRGLGRNSRLQPHGAYRRARRIGQASARLFSLSSAEGQGTKVGRLDLRPSVVRTEGRQRLRLGGRNSLPGNMTT